MQHEEFRWSRQRPKPDRPVRVSVLLYIRSHFCPPWEDYFSFPPPPIKIGGMSQEPGPSRNFSPARILSVNVGMPQPVQVRDRAVLTSIFKSAVSGRRRV